ncbi:unnamed protein product [Rangifer tarandus platyrhynchus]|uniref:Uncharacterized protein n=2 Tax=Rangifer tarandus platyrhynchus TaxID=3082113 RepID=A0AC59Y7L3_RANTA|nr:unnamed protein product [Rangifer tarandus platyrhynchus]
MPGLPPSPRLAGPGPGLARLCPRGAAASGHLFGFRISVSGTALCPGAPAINLKITRSSPSPAFRSIGTATLNLPSLLQILRDLYLGYISQE